MQKGDLNKDMRDFDQVVEKFQDRVREQWEDPTVRRAFKSFRTNFRKTLDNDNTLVRVMFNFSKETSQNINVGRKRKHGSHIPVQSTAKARRKFQNPGRGTVTYGWKEKVVEKRSQMVIDDENDEELTWHSLPTGTRSQIKNKKPHKLSESIHKNVSAARKHEKTMF